MLEAYPQLAGVPLRLRVDCVSEPDPQTTAMLSIVKKQIAFQGIDFELCVHAEPSCGHGCGCEGSEE
jgi:hypothetical protein